jgi:uncharacterized protein (DUF3084 family)
MSDIGLIVILAVLILGGLIATIGDRIGSKVGKARLSLFKLRPKQTATIVTIVTGTLISASTFGILFLSSRQFRDMLTQFDKIRDELKDRTRQLGRTVEDLKKTNEEKTQVEDELNKTRNERKLAESQLKRINQSLKASVEKQRQTDAQLQRTEAQRDVIRGQLDGVSRQAQVLQVEIDQLASDRDRLQADRDRLQADRQTLIAQRDQVRSQIAQRDAQIAERTRLITQRDREIDQRDREIAQRDQTLAQREIKLKQIQQQQALLEAAVQQSDAEARQIRDGFLAILRNQVLSTGVFRVVNPKDARLAIEELLREANRVALQSIQPGATELVQVVGITPEEVEQLIRQVADGRDYVVRIIAKSNYVRGERRPVLVSAFVAQNQLVFGAGDIIATTTFEPAKLNRNDFRRSIDQLIAYSNLRARRAGVLSDDTVQLPEPQAYAAFLEQLRQNPNSVELRVVAADVTYTAGPLRVELIAVQNGQVILRTASRLGNQG